MIYIMLWIAVEALNSHWLLSRALPFVSVQRILIQLETGNNSFFLVGFHKRKSRSVSTISGNISPIYVVFGTTNDNKFSHTNVDITGIGDSNIKLCSPI